MKRNIVAIICVMLATSFIFASCTNKGFITDKNGSKYLVYTDENGEAVTDKSGSTVVVATDAHGDTATNIYGEPRTQILDEPKVTFKKNGKYAESNAFVLNAPSGWVFNTTVDSFTQICLGEAGSKYTMDIYYSVDNYQKAVEDGRELLKKFTEGADKTYISKEEEVSLKNGEIKPVTKFVFLGTGTTGVKDEVVGFNLYVFTANSYTYAIFCTAYSEDELTSINYEAVIETIEFK